MQNNIYTLDPEDIKFDDKYVVFNPLQNVDEYASTLESIRRLGQQTPILMLNGKCIDGRHRTRAAKDLGTMVSCIDVDSEATDEELILLCNTNTMSGRDFDNAQKAIQALNLTRDYNITAKDAAVMFKINKRLVSYAATIRGFNREDILDTLMADKQNRVQLGNMERPSRSLELLAKFVKAEDEKGKLVVDDSERVQWDPDAHIKTESGKAWYYEQIKIADTIGNTHLHILLAELANLKNKVVTNE